MKNVNMTDALHHRIKVAACEKKMTISNYVNIALRTFLRGEEKPCIGNIVTRDDIV